MRFRFAVDLAGLAARYAVPVLLSTFIACGLAVAQQPAKPKASAAAPAAKPAAADNGKCIGVISAIGENFILKKIGITVFGNDEATAPIDSWHVDDLVVSKISGFLAKLDGTPHRLSERDFRLPRSAACALLQCRKRSGRNVAPPHLVGTV
jgi:hypothetical protein